MVRKDNTVWFMGNRYFVPLGTYDGTEKAVEVLEVLGNTLVINDSETKQELARHAISLEKGRLIKNNNHGRDQLQAIQKSIKGIDTIVTEKTLNYCLDHSLFSATDFNDDVDHFSKLQPREGMDWTAPDSSVEIKPLNEIDRSKLETRPMIRDFDYYKEFLERGNIC